jgi:hypothetical protein
MTSASPFYKRISVALGLAATIVLYSNGISRDTTSKKTSGMVYPDNTILANSSGINTEYIHSIQHFKDENGKPIFQRSEDIQNANVVGIDSSYLEVILNGRKNPNYPKLAGLDSSYAYEKSHLLSQAENLIYMRLLHHYFLGDCSNQEIKGMVDDLKKNKKYGFQLSTQFWNDLLK